MASVTACPDARLEPAAEDVGRVPDRRAHCFDTRLRERFFVPRDLDGGNDVAIAVMDGRGDRPPAEHTFVLRDRDP